MWTTPEQNPGQGIAHFLHMHPSFSGLAFARHTSYKDQGGAAAEAVVSHACASLTFARRHWSSLSSTSTHWPTCTHARLVAQVEKVKQTSKANVSKRWDKSCESVDFNAPMSEHDEAAGKRSRVCSVRAMLVLTLLPALV